jgi:type III restriction enzyme
VDERVKFFFKLPGKFKIDTPLGAYNPDWAVVFENDARVYFVAETKSSTVETDRRRDENLKIACGRAHFSLEKDVVFKDVSALQGLISSQTPTCPIKAQLTQEKPPISSNHLT